MSKDINTIYDGVMEFIARATDAASDDTGSMDTLEINIDALTKAINALPLHERLTYQDKLTELSIRLKELEEKLLAKRAAVVAELESQPQQRKAHTAYNKTDKLEG